EQPLVSIALNLSQSDAGQRTPEQEEALPAPQEISLEFKTPQASVRAAGDMATSLETPADNQTSPGPAQREPSRDGAPPFNYEESREEIEFYLRHGFYAEASKAVSELERKYPEEIRVGELRQQVDQSSQGTNSAEKIQAASGTRAEESEGQGWELPTSFSGMADAGGLLETDGHLAGEPSSTPAEFHDAAMSPAASAANQEQVAVPRSAADASVELGSLLDELKDVNEPMHQGDEDDQTHYNLGVAFREMGLLDEAIGELQKVVKSRGSQCFGPNFLQGCTLLASCFMDKGMPALAAKWYSRALEAPGLDHEGMLAIYYDLGIAFEKAGNNAAALEKFTEVYSQNIDYRDVAEKIRLLRHSGR
ncbi:MAG: tetratricopeptide repeat protein, partial [Acidobacteria bacterium]|nr:tetratricopeptide repeat protein [Acidobacteriota bacterium]